MKVYIVFAIYNCRSCGNDKVIKKVFSTEKKMNDYLKTREKEYGSYYDEEEHEVE